MKKIFAMVLAAMLLLSVGAVAVAENTYTDTSIVTITKKYTGSNGSPAEEFELEVESSTKAESEAESIPELEISKVIFSEGAAGSTSNTGIFKITLPEYSNVGVYTYTLKEKDNGTAGVSYRSKPITLVVTVINGDDGFIRIVGVHDGDASASKMCAESYVENKYESGTLKVTKKIKGKLGEKGHKFNFTVNFSAPSGDTVKSKITYGTENTELTFDNEGKAQAKFSLSDSEFVVFNNLPYGVSYTVSEDGAVKNDDGSFKNDDYNVTYDGNENGTIAYASVETIITNTKGDDHTPDTGITTDSLPYVMLLGFVLLAGAALLMKRRMAH